MCLRICDTVIYSPVEAPLARRKKEGSKRGGEGEGGGGSRSGGSGQEAGYEKETAEGAEGKKAGAGQDCHKTVEKDNKVIVVFLYFLFLSPA
jgi:hypothetical protein